MSDRLSIIEASAKQRQRFDPTNANHLAELRFFRVNGKWQKGCPFYLEEPFLEIPAMCYHRLTEHQLGI
jgi:hypothetical protein